MYEMKLKSLPSKLMHLTHEKIGFFSELGNIKFNEILTNIDAQGHNKLEVEIKHILKQNVFFANFNAVLGHVARIPNFYSSEGLDLGCSFGLKTLLLNLFGTAKIIGTDVNTSFIEGANIWNQQTNIKNIKFQINTINKLDFESNRFDWITAMGLYANLTEDATDELFQNCARVLKPGGLLLFHDSANPHHSVTAKRILDYHIKRELGDGTLEKPDGSVFLERVSIIKESFLDFDDKTVDLLAKHTAYMTEDEIIRAGKNYDAKKIMPNSLFEPENIFKSPINPRSEGKTPCRRITDPFQIQKELENVGFEVSFRRPLLGDYIPRNELMAYFKQAPSVFITAKKLVNL